MFRLVFTIALFTILQTVTMKYKLANLVESRANLFCEFNMNVTILPSLTVFLQHLPMVQMMCNIHVFYKKELWRLMPHPEYYFNCKQHTSCPSLYYLFYDPSSYFYELNWIILTGAGIDKWVSILSRKADLHLWRHRSNIEISSRGFLLLYLSNFKCLELGTS